MPRIDVIYHVRYSKTSSPDALCVHPASSGCSLKGFFFMGEYAPWKYQSAVLLILPEVQPRVSPQNCPRTHGRCYFHLSYENPRLYNCSSSVQGLLILCLSYRSCCCGSGLLRRRAAFLKGAGGAIRGYCTCFVPVSNSSMVRICTRGHWDPGKNSGS